MSEPLGTGSCGTRCGTHIVPTMAAQPTQGEKGTRGSTSHTHSRQYNLNDKDTLDVPLDETCMRMGGAFPPAVYLSQPLPEVWITKGRKIIILALSLIYVHI